MTPDENFDEVAAILARALAPNRVWPLPSRRLPRHANPTLEDDDRVLLAYLTTRGSATPAEFGVALGVSHATVSRKLARLVQLGLLISHGNTRAIRYRLAHFDN